MDIHTSHQNEGRQLEAMKKMGVDERDVFMDKQSGKDFDRVQYQLLKRIIRKRDVLYIHSLDRFGRNKKGSGNREERKGALFVHMANKQKGSF